MAEMMTPVFLSLTAHGSMLFCCIFDKLEYVYASLPPQPEINRDFNDLVASITVCLSLSLTFVVVELILLFRQISPRSLFFYSLISHTISCVILLKFILDIHPVNHFWILFVISNCPTLIFQLIILSQSFNKKKFC